MQSLLNLVGAVVIGALVLVTIFGRATTLNQTSTEKTFTLNLQTNAVTAARVLEYDLVKAGFHVPKGTAITQADSVSLTFKADLHDAGTINTVQYYLSSVTDPEVSVTQNPRDRVLHRIVSGLGTTNAILGLTNLKFAYFDSTGNTTSVLADIRSIYTRMDFESAERVIKPIDTPSDTAFPGVYWEKTIYPRNL